MYIVVYKLVDGTIRKDAFDNLATALFNACEFPPPGTRQSEITSPSGREVWTYTVRF